MRKLTLLQWAKAGLPLKTQDGRNAKFVCHIKSADRQNRFICMVDGKIWKRQVNGRHCDTCSGSVYPSIIKDEDK